MKNIMSSWLTQLTDEAVNIARMKNQSVPSDEFIQTFQDLIETKIAGFLDGGLYFTKNQARKMVQEIDVEVDEIVTNAVGFLNNPELSEAVKAFCLMTLAANQMSPQMSGVVISGFGDKEYFPALVEFNIDGYVGQSAKIVEKEVIEIMRDNNSCIRAFAQSDMVERFMNGVDSGFLGVL